MKKGLFKLIRLVKNIQGYYSSNILVKQKSIQNISGITEFHRYGVAKAKELQGFAGFFELLYATKSIEGDIVECGVGRGRSLFYFGFITNLLKSKKLVYGFDSFEGFPEPSKEDKSKRNPQKGDWNFTDINLVKNRFIFADMINFYNDQVKLIKGFFSATLEENLPQKISFLHIDGDLYQSTLDVLNHAYPKLTKGAYVVLDDYDDPKWPGVKKAVSEYMIDKTEEVSYFEVLGEYGFIKI